MSSTWETLYLFKPPPSSGQQSPTPTSPNDKSPSFHFSRTGPEKVSFSVPLNYVFFEERSQNGCPKVLRIHLLGHERCVEHFVKYAETVEALEFHGCLEYLESCFKICSLMTGLKDVRFYLGRIIPTQLRSPKRSKSWNSSGLLQNEKVGALRIVLDVVQYYKQNMDCKNIIDEFLKMTMEYSIEQFQAIHELRLELPDSDPFLSLSKNLMRLPKLPSNPKMEIMVDYRIYCKIENSVPQPPKRSPSFFMASPDTSEAGPTCSSTVQSKEDGKPEIKLQSRKDNIKPEVNYEAEPGPTQSSSKPTIPEKNYSYEMSTAERLLQESGLKSVPATKTTANNKRPGDPLLNPNDPKRPHKENNDEKVSRRDYVTEQAVSTVSRETTNNSNSNSSEMDSNIRNQSNDKDNQNYNKEQSNTTSSKLNRWKETNISKSHSSSQHVRPTDNNDHPTQPMEPTGFSSSYSRRGDLRDDNRSPESQHSDRREHRSFATRSRGNFRGHRGRGRGRPYQDKGSRGRNYDGGR